jgi:phosphomannomutase
VIDPALLAAAEAWRDDDPDPATAAEIDSLLRADDEDGLRERFGTSLTFGTAGLRGAPGAGPYRMNRVVVRRTAAALAAWLVEHRVPGPVVVGRDARHGSREFAEDSARVIAGAGREVVLADGLLPTPVLARAVLSLGAAAGVMVTASHNPPSDNGYKVYAGDGAQIVPPADREIAELIAGVRRVSALPLAPLDDPLIRPLPAAVVDDYLAGVAALRVRPEVPGPVVAYTPMHGVGGATLRQAFAAAGLDVPMVVPEQADPDPDFPTVSFPNPEEPGAMDLLLALAAQRSAHVALANDPDADRLAAAVPDGQGWRVLSGDEIGVLLADHLLRHGSGADRLVVTTVVSSSMLQSLAAGHGVAFAETLTGFKWLARAAIARPDLRFVLGYEEALGYSIGELVRDKDGISAAVVFAELVAALAVDGSSVPRRLDELAAEHGAHVTVQRSWRFEGIDGPQRMADRVARIREAPPRSLGPIAIAEVEDLALGERLPATDAVVLRGDGLRVVVRPSGTEPKLKCYVEAVAPVVDGDAARARTEAGAVVDAVLAELDDLLA